MISITSSMVQLAHQGTPFYVTKEGQLRPFSFPQRVHRKMNPRQAKEEDMKVILLLQTLLETRIDCNQTRLTKQLLHHQFRLYGKLLPVVTLRHSIIAAELGFTFGKVRQEADFLKAVHANHWNHNIVKYRVNLRYEDGRIKIPYQENRSSSTEWLLWEEIAAKGHPELQLLDQGIVPWKRNRWEHLQGMEIPDDDDGPSYPCLDELTAAKDDDSLPGYLRHGHSWLNIRRGDKKKLSLGYWPEYTLSHTSVATTSLGRIECPDSYETLVGMGNSYNLHIRRWAFKDGLVKNSRGEYLEMTALEKVETIIHLIEKMQSIGLVYNAVSGEGCVDFVDTIRDYAKETLGAYPIAVNNPIRLRKWELIRAQAADETLRIIAVGLLIFFWLPYFGSYFGRGKGIKVGDYTDYGALTFTDILQGKARFHAPREARRNHLLDAMNSEERATRPD